MPSRPPPPSSPRITAPSPAATSVAFAKKPHHTKSKPKSRTPSDGPPVPAKHNLGTITERSGKLKPPALKVNIATKRFDNSVEHQRALQEKIDRMNGVEPRHDTKPLPIPPPQLLVTNPSFARGAPAGALAAGLSGVTAAQVDDSLQRCVEVAVRTRSSISAHGRLGQVVGEVVEMYNMRKTDLLPYMRVPPTQPTTATATSAPSPDPQTPTTAFLTPTTLAHIPSPTSPTPRPSLQKPLTPVGRALSIFYGRTEALTNRLSRYGRRKVGFGRARKVREGVEAWAESWRDVMIQLTLTLARDGADAAEVASGKVAKLAVATGAPDWEELTLDDAQKLFMQGDKFLLGFGVTRSYDIAFKRYMAAAQRGSTDAIHMVGAMFEHGLGRPMDMAAAIRWYQQSASRNHTDSLSAMGRIHETGKGVPQDPRTAYELYLLAAEAGHVDAMCCVASLLQRVPQSLTNYDADGSPAEAAVAWYRLAAQHGSPRGQNALGSCYYRGLGGVERDYGNAVVWFRRAAESGDPAAHNNLGICYEEGVGVARDVVMAKTLYKLAAAGGHAGATNNLGYLALVEKNFMEAIHQFHLAITLGSVDAAYNLATLYESGCSDASGRVLPKDTSMAVRYYKEAADKNHTKAQLRLARIYTTHPPPLQNHPAAIAYLTRAAAAPSTDLPSHDISQSPGGQGDANAQNMLGELLELGWTGTEAPDGVGAKSVQSDGDGDGDGDGEQQQVGDYAGAATWYRKAMRQGHARATYNLAALYEVGSGVGKDVEKALRLYKEAEQRGCKEARERLDILSELGISPRARPV